MRLSAVIGASYGDEGKGHTVDFLSDSRTLVVRFNGGAQAGHTVVNGGRRHVFHHLGAGTFQGATTYLSEHFILNPILFRMEHALFPRAEVWADPACLVTTPFDMMLNQAVEARRGEHRHGSCGIGINETVTRSLAGGGFQLRLAHAERDEVLRERLHVIREDWVPRRAAELGLDLADLPWCQDGRILDRFIEDVRHLRVNVRRRGWEETMRAERPLLQHVLFEGAQGLRLDEESPEFPHVTRSRTGLTNVLRLMDAGDLGGPLDVYYVTRPYLTRHGAGPLAGELDGPPFPGIVDRTNVPNRHQGALRFALLDPEAVAAFIRADLARARGRPVTPRLALTCVDQVPEIFSVSTGPVTAERLAGMLEESAGLEGHLLLQDEPAPRRGAFGRTPRPSPRPSPQPEPPPEPEPEPEPGRVGGRDGSLKVAVSSYQQ